MNSSIYVRIVEDRLRNSTQPDINLFRGDASEDTQLIGWGRIAKRVTALALLMVLAWVGTSVHTQYLEMQTERLIAASNDLRL